MPGLTKDQLIDYCVNKSLKDMELRHKYQDACQDYTAGRFDGRDWALEELIGDIFGEDARWEYMIAKTTARKSSYTPTRLSIVHGGKKP